MKDMENKKPDYTAMSLEELKQEQEKYHQKDASIGGKDKSDTSINDINIELIKKYADRVSNTYMGRIVFNMEKFPCSEITFTYYHGQEITAGTHDFIIPLVDSYLCDLILEYRKETNPQRRQSLLLQIENRIMKLGGMSFIWA